MVEEHGPRAPKLRFRSFDGDWERKPLSVALVAKGKRNYEKTFGRDDVLSVSGELGIINQIEHLGRSYAGVSVEDYHVVDTGDLVYTKSPLKRNPYGIIKANKGRPGIVSTLYAVYEVRQGHSSEFWDRYFELDDHTNRYLKPLVNKGAKNDMKINNDKVLIDPVYFPSVSEQEKIAAFFSAIDVRLNALRRKVHLMVEYKRGVMQRLFSQELRFRHDDGTPFPDWQEKRFGDVFGWVRTNSLSREFLTYEAGSVQNIHYGDIHTKFKANFRQSTETVPYIAATAATGRFPDEEFCRAGDVVIADASEDYADIGKAIEIVEVRAKSLVAGLHTHLARPRSATAVLGFSGYLLRSAAIRKQIMRIAQGISVLGISKTSLEKLTFYLPHPDEQRTIADFLSALDAGIDGVASQVTQTEGFKKGLLQQMFL